MELNEIWEQGFVSYNICRPDYDSETCDAFIAGCEFEHSRSHWFDPEKVLPPKEAPVNDLSISVLVKDEYDNVWSDQWDYDQECWDRGKNERVISWAYIPK